MENNSVDIINTAAAGGGITGALVAIAMVIRKFYAIYSDSRKEYIRDAAEFEVVDMLRKEVARLSERLQTIEDTHKEALDVLRKEQEEEHKEEVGKLTDTYKGDIEKLKAEVENLKEVNERFRRQALQAYKHLLDDKADDSEELKKLLAEMIDIF